MSNTSQDTTMRNIIIGIAVVIGIWLWHRHEQAVKEAELAAMVEHANIIESQTEQLIRRLDEKEAYRRYLQEQSIRNMALALYGGDGFGADGYGSDISTVSFGNSTTRDMDFVEARNYNKCKNLKSKIDDEISAVRNANSRGDDKAAKEHSEALNRASGQLKNTCGS